MSNFLNSAVPDYFFRSTFPPSENDEEMRQILREDSTYKWKKNSPHELAKHGGEHGESAASSTVA